MDKNKIKLDVFDYKILSFLEDDANRGVNILAKKINKSREFCEYRIKRLKFENIIKEISASINAKKLGFTTYNFLFKLQEIDNIKLKEFENFLIESANTKYICESSGDWDYEVSIIAKEISQLSKFLEDIYEKFGSNIKENNFHLRTKTLYFGSFLKVLGKKEYFEKEEKSKNKKKVKNKNSNYTLDDLDFSILEELSINATYSTKELAKKLNTTFDKIRYRLENLNSNNYITSINAKINQNYFGYQVYSIGLKIKNLNKEKEKQLKKFFKINRYVFFALRIVGNWDVKLQILAKDQNNLKEFITELREELKEDLQYYSFSVKLNTLKQISFSKN